MGLIGGGNFQDSYLVLIYLSVGNKTTKISGIIFPECCILDLVRNIIDPRIDVENIGLIIWILCLIRIHGLLMKI